MEKYNGFTIASIEYQKKNKGKHLNQLILFISQQKKNEIEPACYFSEDISKAYSSLHLEGKKGLARAHKVYQRYYCIKFFLTQFKQKRHTENCSGKPGVVYSFNNQCLISYVDNSGNKGDLPFVIYFDFETTEPIDNCLDPEQKKNVCSFLCNDFCVSSGVKIRLNYSL